MADDQLDLVLDDRDFLLARASNAGRCNFGGKRWTGLSSNALVEVAFGQRNDRLPSDGSDLAACYRTVQALPSHRVTEQVLHQLNLGEKAVGEYYPDAVKWAREQTGWPEIRHVNLEDLP